MWSTPATFARLRERFEAAGYSTHAPALPYHDRAPDLPPLPEVGRLTVEDYVRYLMAEIAKLPEPPVLIGHSMGGMLAQAVAARVPHAGLVLLSTAPTAATVDLTDFRPLRAFTGTIFRWGWWHKPTTIDADRARWSIYNGVPADIASAEIAALVPDSGRVLAEMLWPGLSETGATRIDYGRLTRKALVIVGLDDRITPAATSRATARRLSGPVDYHELPGVSHWLFWGDTERQVGDLIEGWLKTLA